MEDVQIVIGNGVDGGARSRLRKMISGAITGSPLIDIGTTSLTGIRAGGIPGFCQDRPVGSPIYATLALEPADCQYLGSDFIRAGLLFDQLGIADEQWVDTFGVHWQLRDGNLSPVGHPLEDADPMDAEYPPKPQWKQPAQHIDAETAEGSVVIADAPCPGLLNLCFMLRNTWRFLEDISFDRGKASALLEWSMETIAQSYAHLLGSLPEQPDVIVYSDDLGSHDSMLLSPSDFRNHVLPRLRALLEEIQGMTKAAVCFHSCGAIGPILSDIVDLGVEIINVDTKAKGMAVGQVRRMIPASLILHGSHDLCGLGEAIANQDKAKVARFTEELAQSAPVVAGPADSLGSMGEALNAVRGAAFLRNLSDDDFNRLREIGPVRQIIEDAMEKTLTASPLDLERSSIHRQSGAGSRRNQFSPSGRRWG